METKNINRQLQVSSLFGNRMVTYDGLVDFLEMLKKEIPCRGINNDASGTGSYALGEQNTAEGDYSCYIGLSINGTGDHTFCAGSSNVLDASYSTVFGSSNHIKKGKFISVFGEENGNEEFSIQGEHIFITGKSNKMRDGEDFSNITIFGQNNTLKTYVYNSKIIGDNNTIANEKNIYIFGNNLSSIGDQSEPREKPLYLLGVYNAFGIDGALIPNTTAVLIGDGNADERRNLLSIGYDGEIWIRDGYVTSEIAFNNKVFFSNRHSSEKAKIYLGDKDNGGTFPTTIIDNTEDADSQRSLLYHAKGFRHVLHPWTATDTDTDQYNEAIWNVRSKVTNENGVAKYMPEKILHINASNPSTKKDGQVSEVGGTYFENVEVYDEQAGEYLSGNNIYEYYAPQEIDFHAGSPKSWAQIKCLETICTTKLIYNYTETREIVEDTDGTSFFEDWYNYCQPYGLVSMKITMYTNVVSEANCTFLLAIYNQKAIILAAEQWGVAQPTWIGTSIQDHVLVRDKWETYSCQFMLPTSGKSRVSCKGTDGDTCVMHLEIQPLTPKYSNRGEGF